MRGGGPSHIQRETPGGALVTTTFGGLVNGQGSRSVRRALALTILFPFVVTSCGGKGTPPAGPQMGSASPLSDRALVQLKDAPPGLDLRVSDGKAGPPAFDRAKLAPATKLTQAEADALLARGRPIQKDPDDQKDFALRPNSQ